MKAILLNHESGRKLETFKQILLRNGKIALDPQCMEEVARAHAFLGEFSRGKVIYGVNTGFGPMAQYSIPPDQLCALQYNLVRSHCTGMGEEIPSLCVKSALVCRLLSLLRAASGVHPEVPTLIAELINRNILPVVYRHGSVGASGDLVQLAHIALSFMGEGEVRYKGRIRQTAEVFELEGLRPIRFHIREGLALCNGTSMMTGIGIVNLIYVHRLFQWAVRASAFINEITEAYDESFSEGVNMLKEHPGQQAVANMMRDLLKDSTLICRRADSLYRAIPETRVFEKKIQEYYSLRCVPQILGPVADTVQQAMEVVMAEAVSVNDNPVIDMQAATVLHGGNFHGDYISLEMDKLKIAVTRLTMLMERQMNYLLNPKLNEKFPPFVNLGVPGVQLGMQAAQFPATSTTAESQTLSFPHYLHSIPNNNDNQDIVSMGTNAAMICHRVIQNGFDVMALHIMTLVQAVDAVAMADRLCPSSKRLYDAIRGIFPPYRDKDALYPYIAQVRHYLYNNEF